MGEEVKRAELELTSRAEKNGKGEGEIDMRLTSSWEKIHAHLFVMLDQTKGVKAFVTRAAPEARLVLELSRASELRHGF